MSDDIGQDLGAPAADIAGMQPESPKGPLASPVARIVVIVAAVAGLLVVGGIVLAIVLFTFGQKSAEQAAVDNLNASLNAPQAVAATSSVETTAPVTGNVQVVPVTNSDVFTARDPFEPVIKPLPEVTTTPSVPATGSADWNTLVLENIVTSNGVLTAILKWNGSTYTAVAGQQLDSSPWQVLSITKTTATMLYGDVQVTLSIGEGVAQ